MTVSIMNYEMNILFLTTHFNTGGITNYILTLSRQLTEKGCRVVVVSSGGERVEDLKNSGAEHITIDCRTKSILSPKLLAAVLKLKKIVKDERIDIIHAHTRVTQWLACWSALMTAIPFVSTCHGFFRPRFFRRFLPCWGKKVIAISDQVAQHLTDDFNVDPESVVTVRNGIDLELFVPANDLDRKDRQRQAGFVAKKIAGIVARLSDVKGHSVLIDAMVLVKKHDPDIIAVIVGEGKEEQRLKSQVDRLGLSDTVFFYPVVNRTADFLNMFDCFVLPSLMEGLGLSVMEAQAAALPVIASRIGGIPSLIEDGITGILTEPGNALMLSEKIIQVIEDKQLAASIARNARRKAEAEYGAEQMADQILDVYEKTLTIERKG